VCCSFALAGDRSIVNSFVLLLLAAAIRAQR